MANDSVQQIMQANPVVALKGDRLVDVVDKMIRHHLMGMPVVDGNRRLVGFVSEQDCIPTMIATSYFCEGNPGVDDVMSTAPLSVRVTDSVLDLASRIGRDKPKIYPVVDGERLVGVISRSDILRFLRREAVACNLATRRA